MLADTVESACRSLENPTEERLEKFIQALINAKIEQKQLNNCELTFHDITKIKETFLQILVGYYHSRIKYPDQKDPDAKKSDAVKTEAEIKKNTERDTVSVKKAKTLKNSDEYLGDKTLDEVKKNV